MVVGFYYLIFVICIAHQTFPKWGDRKSPGTEVAYCKWWVFLPLEGLIWRFRDMPTGFKPKEGEKPAFSFNLQSIRLLIKSFFPPTLMLLKNIPIVKKNKLMLVGAIFFSMHKEVTQKYVLLFTGDCYDYHFWRKIKFPIWHPSVVKRLFVQNFFIPLFSLFISFSFISVT